MTSTGPLSVLTVSQLNRRVKQLLDGELSLVWVEGEISNFKHHSSGHMYFSLKDERAEVAVVMFASANSALSFEPGNGMKILLRGTASLYESRGQYQLYAQNLYPAGAGELWLAFEALKNKLQSEGLFDPNRKKALPEFPRRIGVVTSPTGAAVRDIINVITRRAPHVTIVIRPTLVQGDGAKEDIVDAIQEFNAYGSVDLIIMGRGGGSLEDLWPFNEEAVARAVAASEIPTISAVGHETDLTICDLVSDLRAPTPSAAAELAVRDRGDYLLALDEWRDRLERLVHQHIVSREKELLSLKQRYGFRQPGIIIQRQQERLKLTGNRLEALGKRMIHLQSELLHQWEQNYRRALHQMLAWKSQRLMAVTAQLRTLNPDNILQRGYSIITDEKSGQIVASRGMLQTDQELELHFHDGQAGARVTRI